MKKIMISVLGWSSAVFLLLGAFRFVNISARDLNIERVGSAILLCAVGALTNFIANRLGWNSPGELIRVIQFFARLKAFIGKRIPPIVQDGLPPKKRTFRLLHPPIRMRIYLYAICLICLLFAFALDMIAGVRVAPIFGSSPLNIAEDVFVALAAVCFIINILLSVLFFLRSFFLFLKGKG